jgi:hypothetical protein
MQKARRATSGDDAAAGLNLRNFPPLRNIAEPHGHARVVFDSRRRAYSKSRRQPGWDGML